MPITTLPPAPEPTDSTSQFNAKSFAWVAALDQFTTEANALESNVDALEASTQIFASNASNSATQAAASATTSATNAATALTHASAAAANTNAPLWVSGTTYAAGALVYSAVDGRTYRRKTAGGGTTNPASDSTNWTPLFLEIDTQRPSIRPSLLLDFANTKQLDPRVTFSRASTGTYYNGKTVAKAEENLFTYSQEFDNAAWTSPISSATVAANAASAPDGTSTADRLQGLTASWYRAQNVTLTSGSSYTISMYVKSNTGSSQTFRLFGSSSISSSEFTATTSWQLFTHTFTATASTLHGITRDVANNTVDLLLWGAQLEQRSTVTAYTTTTTAPITNYIPALQTAAAGVARFDHNPVTGESLGLEIEEQRTNLVTYSEQFDNAAWNKSNSTITSNTIVAPDGLLSADKFVNNSGISGTGLFGASGIYQNCSTVSGSVYTFSIYVKAGENNTIGLSIADGNFGTNGVRATANLGTVTTTNLNNAFSSLVYVGNGWYRFIVTSTTAQSVTGAPRCYVYNPTIGDGYSGIYIWGAQIEAGSFPTSYIPTVSSQVTRSADSASMTGANFSSWYRADEGTLYAEWSPTPAQQNREFVHISDGTYNNFYSLGNITNGNVIGQLYASGTSQIYHATGVNLSSNKAVISYAPFSKAYTLNGTGMQTNSSQAIPIGASQLGIGTASNNASSRATGTIKRLAYYPKRLSNTELQAITS